MRERSAAITTLADSIPGAQIVGGERAAAVRVSGLACDSRGVRPGDLYVAVVGDKFDGHAFLSAARASGAAAFVLQEDRAAQFADWAEPALIVPSTRAALAPLACRFYGDPTRALYLAGVTGTNGKTTVTRMIDAIARAAGDKTGVIGTLGATIDGRDLPGDRTTPEAPDLQRLFAEMRDEGVGSAAIEVASHAIAMGRTEGCAFDVGLFTNLTQDHLDYHGTMENYRDVKARLFTEYADAARAAGKSFVAVVNAGDAAGRHYAEITRATRRITYGVDGKLVEKADVVAQGIDCGIDAINYCAQMPAGGIEITLPFGGAFQVENSLAAIGYGIARGLSRETIAEGLGHCPPVPGRFQPVRAGQDFAVLVDYAHTPDGLENVLRSARPLTPGRLIVVFGCGGDRDRTKRPKMGRIAGEIADIALVTSDNPRSESPEAIIDEVLTGMAGVPAQVLREADRRDAIAQAVQTARPGDTIVIAGKGHETYQIVGDQTFPFDDAAVAAQEIERVR